MAKRSKKKSRMQPGARIRSPVGSKADAAKPAFDWWRLVQAALIAAAVCWAFGPSIHGDWLWDDDFYITNNVLIHDPMWLWKIWFLAGSVVNYFPITATVAWVQWHLWGLDTFGYHVTNIVLHIVGALLFWRLLTKLGLRHGWLGGLIFAVHPTGVESVAWISELKNTLSLPPFLMAMCCYIEFDETNKRREYLLAFGWFVVAMLCKVTMIAFPFVILLYAWWKRNRIGWADLRATLPFLAISLVLGPLNIVVLQWFQINHGGIHENIPLGGPITRLAGVGLALSFYLGKALLPVDLSPMYPRWEMNPLHVAQFLPWLVLAAFAFVIWRQRHSWGRPVALGLGYFLVMLAPFAGFFGNSFMRFTWVMDHFLYLPILGLIGLLVAGFDSIEGRLPGPWKHPAIALVVLLAGLLAIETNGYADVWRSQLALWTYTTHRYPDSAWLAWNDLGNAQVSAGRMDEAIVDFRQSIRLNPSNADAHYNLGFALKQNGQVQAAFDEYQQALAIDPHHALSHLNLGTLLIGAGQVQEAAEQFALALQSDPNEVNAHNNLGNILRQSGRVNEAIDHYQQAIRINPDYAEAHGNLATALVQVGRYVEAGNQCQIALRLDPHLIDARNTWVVALANQNQISAAIDQLKIVLQLDPQNKVALSNLAQLRPQAAPNTGPKKNSN